ncbi:MAG: ribbon-helix-helix protein, CopG family [Nocardioidaceae bacterium]
MRSLRLPPALDEQLVEAAARRGESVSEFIRNAVAERIAETPGEDRLAMFADVIGVVHGGGGVARRTGSAFREVLATKHETTTPDKRRTSA